MIPFRRWMRRLNRPLLTRFKKNEKTRRIIIVSIAFCRLFIRLIGSSSWSRQIVEEGRASEAQEGWYYEQYQRQKQEGWNKMSIETTSYRDHAYPTVFLKGFICLLTSHHFFRIVTLLPKMIDGPFDRTDPRWRASGTASMGGFYLLSWSSGAAD